ncbi:MAG TPA: hypothetical protein VFH06_02540 [Candidatus Saccharimonadales bacterium]|nr:hypothetical protein [Candidatus Saccharimonadales bacterium]
MESSKATHKIGDATALAVFWAGNLTAQELPANTDYVEVEAPCPDGCSWEIRKATAEDITAGKAEGTLICFLRHEGVDVSTFFTAGLEMIVRMPAGSSMALSFR